MNDKNSIKSTIVMAINNILSSRKGSKYADIQEIYKEVALLKGVEINESLKAQVRGRLQEHCSQYKNYTGPDDLFETKAINSGCWRNKITGEKSIRKHIISLVNEFPGIDITQLKEYILTSMKDELTEADKIESKTRPGEMKVEQIIRNLVSHRDSYKDVIEFKKENEITRLYPKHVEARDDEDTLFSIDDEVIEKVLDKEEEKPIIDQEETKLLTLVEIPNKKSKNNLAKKTYIRKSDFERKLQEYNKKMDNGYVAEGLAYQHEIDKLVSMGRKDLAEKVRWVSRDDGDGYGYDIQSFDIINGEDKIIYIEVKSTSDSISSDFEMSANEIKFAEEHIDEFKIYRVYKNKNVANFYIIESGNDLKNDFEIEPTKFKVSIKPIEQE